MSTTTTDSSITISALQTLAEYDIHHTGEEVVTSGITSPNTSNVPTIVENPPSWPQNQHRVPNHRPINRHLNFSERPNGSNGAERVFITVMFTGVALNAVSRLLRGL
ncbi:hypothetical protein SBOR_5719 [Sclerotinia borealis F-4128]|uniref:Uncharacterized protein n=1 Tax=Sclerotinia borealis (strain F-4128) TaxID=1432307 RepID=W9CDH9_SCLBF|nr:hypothetical protein SBOR_5719 [Sclerotinia borealis F-4128]